MSGLAAFAASWTVACTLRRSRERAGCWRFGRGRAFDSGSKLPYSKRWRAIRPLHPQGTEQESQNLPGPATKIAPKRLDHDVQQAFNRAMEIRACDSLFVGYYRLTRETFCAGKYFCLGIMRIPRFTAAVLAATSLAAQAHIAPHIAAEMKIMMISAACSSFGACYGFLPPQTNWFAELTASTNAFLNQRKIVFLNATDIKDPWGRDIVCRIPGTHNTAGADVYSLGEDGRSSSGGNDPDDINNWNSAKPWSEYYAGIHPRFQQVALAAGAAVVCLVLYAVFHNRTKTE